MIASTQSDKETRGVPTFISPVMVLVALSLAIVSALHLAGHVHGRRPPFNATHAGLAESVIAVVLFGAVLYMLREPTHAKTAGIASLSFAILGFLVGLRFTTLGGDRPDIAYHLVLLPVLLACLIVLVRWSATARAARRIVRT
jgi:hypothetical protein